MNKINLFNPFLHGFLHAVVVACVVTVIIWIHFVVVIFSLHINAQQVLLALFIGFLNTITCVCRKGVEAGFSQLVNGRCMILAWKFRHVKFGRCVSPSFTRGSCVCAMCVCVCTHIYCTWGTRIWVQVSGQDTWRALKKSRCSVAIAYTYAVHVNKVNETCPAHITDSPRVWAYHCVPLSLALVHCWRNHCSGRESSGAQSIWRVDEDAKMATDGCEAFAPRVTQDTRRSVKHNTPKAGPEAFFHAVWEWFVKVLLRLMLLVLHHKK